MSIQEESRVTKSGGKGGRLKSGSSGRNRKEKQGGDEGESDSSSGEKVSFAGERNLSSRNKSNSSTSVKKLKKRRGIPVAPPKLPSSDSVLLPPSLFLTSGLRNKQGSANHSSDSGTFLLFLFHSFFIFFHSFSFFSSLLPLNSSFTDTFNKQLIFLVTHSSLVNRSRG